MKKEWTYKKLGEVCGKPSNIKWDEVPKDRMFHYMDLTSVDRETLTINAPQVINSKDAPSRAKQIVRFADVLFATTRPTLKRICIIPKEYDNQICSTGFCILRPNTNILSEWIFYLLLNDNFYKYVEPLQTGANYPAVTDKVIKDYKIPVPPLSEQQQIVSRLDSAFAKVDAVKANAEKQLNDAKALFQKELSKAMIPKEGWEEKKLGEVCVISGDYGLSVSSKPFDGVRYIRITDITEYGELNDDKVSALIDENKKQEKLKDGDILFARTGATVGKTLIYNERYGDCLFAGYLIRYRLDKNIILPQFMYYVTHSSEYYEWVNVNQEAAAQPNISAKKYSLLPISHPPLSEQQAIVTHLDTLSEKLKAVEKKQKTIMAECDAMKQALLREVFE